MLYTKKNPHLKIPLHIPELSFNHVDVALLIFTPLTRDGMVSKMLISTILQEMLG